MHHKDMLLKIYGEFALIYSLLKYYLVVVRLILYALGNGR